METPFLARVVIGGVLNPIGTDIFYRIPHHQGNAGDIYKVNKLAENLEYKNLKESTIVYCEGSLLDYHRVARCVAPKHKVITIKEIEDLPSEKREEVLMETVSNMSDPDKFAFITYIIDNKKDAGLNQSCYRALFSNHVNFLYLLKIMS